MIVAPRAHAHRSRWLGLLALVVLLGGCGEAHVVRRAPAGRVPMRAAAQPPASRRAGAGEVEVVRGDTLYGVAFRNGLDFRDLAAINGIEPPYTIYVGQVLKLHGEHRRATTSAGPVAQAPPGRSRPVATPANVGSTPPRRVPPAEPSTAVASSAINEPKPAAPTPFQDVPPAAATPDRDASAPSSGVVLPRLAPPEVAQVTAPIHPPAGPAPASATRAQAVAPQPQTTGSAGPAVAAAGTSSAVRGEDEPRTPSAAILPADVATVGGIHWRWPARGSLLDRFMPGDATKQGIDIAGRAGDPVVAASDGVVVYSGSGLVGYGELVIIKHSDEWLSAYGHNRKRLVQEGQRVKAGQAIAEMGNSGAPRDELHFEIRRNGRPVDPMQYLPAH